jgi:hypothetical protein
MKTNVAVTRLGGRITGWGSAVVQAIEKSFVLTADLVEEGLQ